MNLEQYRKIESQTCTCDLDIECERCQILREIFEKGSNRLESEL